MCVSGGRTRAYRVKILQVPSEVVVVYNHRQHCTSAPSRHCVIDKRAGAIVIELLRELRSALRHTVHRLDDVGDRWSSTRKYALLVTRWTALLAVARRLRMVVILVMLMLMLMLMVMVIELMVISMRRYMLH